MSEGGQRTVTTREVLSGCWTAGQPRQGHASLELRIN